jgi:hypothetical protein
MKMEAADSPGTTLATHHLHYVTSQTTRTFVTIDAVRTSNSTLSCQYESIPQYRLEKNKLLDEFM